jgi:hypothetical protein
MRTAALFALLAAGSVGAGLLTGCSSIFDGSDSSNSADTALCPDVTDTYRFDNGDPNGHADPLGAAAAKQARAGKITKTADIAQPADARHKIRLGDYVLANDKIAVYIEDASKPGNMSDGYFPFGGEILGLEKIGADGRPQAVSHYGETVLLFGIQTVAPDSVTVLNDGSDGQPAIIRASGILKLIPSIDAFITFFPDQYGFPAAVDYILAPGASHVTMRYSLANIRTTATSFINRQHFGVFQSSFSETFSETTGFDKLNGPRNFVAWEQGDSSFLIQPKLGTMQTFLSTNGLEAYRAPPISLDPCSKRTVDYADVVVGGPGIDGLLEAKRTDFAEPAWHAVTGTVTETGAGPIAGAEIHATTATGYLTRAVSGANGKYTIHVPTGGGVSLTATAKGWAVPPAKAIADTDTDVTLSLPKRATIHVKAIESDSGQPLPVRVQIIPNTAIAKSPPAFGVISDEPDDRLYREYAINGELSVPVPPGGYRVVVTHGYEYELSDTPVLAQEGQESLVAAALKHSVDTTGSMCADFHVHSQYSVDSPDPVEAKVRAALADALEIPVSSEHEYIIDFQPVIQRLGMTQWAFGMASEELTTFKYGHFGVFPLVPDTNKYNNGAFDWSYQTPATILPTVDTETSQPMLIVNHPRGSMGYFDLTGYDRATGKGKDGLWSDNFNAIEVFNNSDLETNRSGSVADWFGMLNAGRKMAATGASDSHHLSTSPVGYPRTCLRFGHDDPTKLTPNAVRDALKAGAAVVSGGISMSAAGPDGTTPGGDSTAGKYAVTISSPSWINPTTLEVIVDGITTQTITLPAATTPAGQAKVWNLEVDVAAAGSRAHHWVVFHAKGDGDLAPLNPGAKPFAVSNPIYF